MKSGLIRLGLVLVFLGVAFGGLSHQVAAAQTTQQFKCQLISGSRTDKLEGGFFSWTAKNPSTATGVILVAKLLYPPEAKELLSGDLALEYKVAEQTQKNPALGFNPRAPDPNRSSDADKLFWILHASSTYKIPVDGGGFDGVIGEETMQFLFQVPNEVTSVSLIYQGRHCGEEAKIPNGKS